MTTTKVNLANTVEGILPVANGGTGTSTGVAPGGSTTQVQYNNAGVFGGDSGFVYTSGNVGIGIASPTSKLVVQQANNTGDAFRVFANGTDTQLISRYLSSSDVWQISASFASTGAYKPITFFTSDAERMRITSAGNVGIGATDPVARLDVRGILAISNAAASYWGIDRNDSDGSLTFADSTTERFRFGTAGQFGIAGANYGSSGQVLTSNGSGSAPSWGSVSLPAGTVLQVVSTNFTSLVTLSSTSLSDVSGFSATITPSSSSNKILIITSVAFGFNNDTYPYVRLNRNGSSIFNGTSAGGNQINVFLAGTGTSTSGTAYRIMQPSKTVLDSPATTSAVTYQIQGASGAGTGYINRQGDQSNNAYIQYPTSTITLMEIKG
jgi:hypothetical protein